MKPDPLTPPDCDLRDFPWMPLDVIRLRDSDLTVLLNGDAFRAAVLLWCASWHQIPASSLPNDDRVLAKLAGYGRDVESWAKVRDDALHGFIECSDGRLYHPVVAEKALEAMDQRKRQQERTQKATEARRGRKRNAEPDDRNDDRYEERDDDRDDTARSNRNGSRNEVQQTRPDRDIERDNNKSKTTTESLERAPPATPEPPPTAPTALSRRSNLAFGSPLPADWIPSDKLCDEVKSKHGMTEEDIRNELLAFHAHNTAQGVLSKNWDSTFRLFCKRWAEHKAKQPAPRVELSKPAERKPEDLTEADWERELAFYARTGRWSRGLGPDPMSPACKAPRHLYEKHGIDLQTGERRMPPLKGPAMEDRPQHHNR